ncbi:MAG: hypothetical protein ABI626_01080 [Sphingomicrobium sp.]
MPKHSQILNAASNLLGIALIIVTAIHVTGGSAGSTADEIAWLSAVCFSLSCLFSYVAIRAGSNAARFELWADRVFLVGLFGLLLAVTTLAFIDS